MNREEICRNLKNFLDDIATNGMPLCLLDTDILSIQEAIRILEEEAHEYISVAGTTFRKNDVLTTSFSSNSSLNGSVELCLRVTMKSGQEYLFRHRMNYPDPVDVFDIERRIYGE